MKNKHSLLQVRLTPLEHEEFFNAIECFSPVYNRRGQATDLIRPAISSFIKAAKNGKGVEFIEYMQAFNARG